MKEELFKNYMDRIRHAPEQRILQEIDYLRWSFGIFHRNNNQLINLLMSLEDKPESIALWDVNKKIDLNLVFEEIGRLLFNYLASAFMLIDHTRRYIEQTYESDKYTNFNKEYEIEKTQRFVNNVNHQIAQGLRNYMQHRKLPSVGSVITYTPSMGLKKAFTVSPTSLLEWDGWSKIAREKLESSGDTFQLRDFVQQYFQQVESFHKWLWSKQVELHQEDVDRLNQLIREARIEFKKNGLLNDDELKEFDTSS
jgi:hypothetical protein